jgi:hypothetical protein
MKFKGVVTKKGRNRGDVVEYSPEEKVRVALGIGITKSDTFEAHLVHAKNIEIQTLQIHANGDPLKRMWQNNAYEARGRIEVARRHMGKDRILRPQTFDFSIKVEDCLCPNGLPDLKTSELVLDPV